MIHSIDELAQSTEMSDEEKAAKFNAQMREEFPEADNADLNTLREVILKLEKAKQEKGTEADG